MNGYVIFDLCMLVINGIIYFRNPNGWSAFGMCGAAIFAAASYHN